MKRNKFNLSHQINTTLNLGGLYPIGVVEVLPGDVFNHKVSAFLRVQPTQLPIMHPTHVDLYTFFVPNRLIWDSFESFIVGEDVTFPHVNFSKVDPGSLADYLGLPGVGTFGQSGVSCNALPFRAYNLIYNEYFRDEQLGAPAEIDVGAGTDTTTDTDIQIASWRKDRFTSARPSPQSGDAPSIPIDLDITATATTELTPEGSLGFTIDGRDFTLTGQGDNSAARWDSNAPSGPAAEYSSGINAATNVTVDGSSTTVGISVEDLRNTLAIQRFLERMNRTGQRYTEYLRSMGIKSSDARLDRPEWLSHGKQTLQFDEVLQTAPSTQASRPGVGNYKGHGIGALRSSRYVRHFNEHGIIMTLAAIRPTTMYMAGAPRMWFRETYTEYFQPEFQHLGMQPVYVGEVDMANATDHNTIFGYQDAYDEYRHQPSYVSGQMNTDEYKAFHFGRQFASEPSLNESFVQCVPRSDPFQLTDQPEIFGMIRHDMRARRLLRRRGTPLTL